jgi:hypothetical protein
MPGKTNLWVAKCKHLHPKLQLREYDDDMNERSIQSERSDSAEFKAITFNQTNLAKSFKRKLCWNR